MTEYDSLADEYEDKNMPTDERTLRELARYEGLESYATARGFLVGDRTNPEAWIDSDTSVSVRQ